MNPYIPQVAVSEETVKRNLRYNFSNSPRSTGSKKVRRRGNFFTLRVHKGSSRQRRGRVMTCSKALTRRHRRAIFSGID